MILNVRLRSYFKCLANFVLKVSPSRDHSVDRTIIVIRLWPGLGSTAGPNLDVKLVSSVQTEGI
jgi:hypothetical protein